MKNILILTLVSFCISSYAQEVQIVAKNDNYIQKEIVVGFEFINSKMNLINQEKVVVLKGFSINSGKNTLIRLFNTFGIMSNNFGANSYIIDEVERVFDTVYVQISAYYLDSTALEDNAKLYPQNMVYVLGDIDIKNGKEKKIKLNGTNIKLAPLEYAAFQNEVGKHVTVSVGGSFGAKVDIKGIEEKLPVYLAFSGFAMGPGYFNPISVRVSTGKIHPVEMNFGQFLTAVLTKKE